MATVKVAKSHVTIVDYDHYSAHAVGHDCAYRNLALVGISVVTVGSSRSVAIVNNRKALAILNNKPFVGLDHVCELAVLAVPVRNMKDVVINLRGLSAACSA